MKTIEQADLILVDTSIWIDFFRKRENIFEQLNQLVEEKRVATVKLVIAELIQGARQEKEIEVHVNRDYNDLPSEKKEQPVKEYKYRYKSARRISHRY